MAMRKPAATVYPVLQVFDDVADARRGAERVSLLRAELKTRGLDGMIVPRTDEFQNEYVPPCAERLAWLTGFTGSAGSAVVLPDSAAIFVDGRYKLQVRDQVDVKIFKPYDVGALAPAAWIEKHAITGQRIGYDPWLHTPAQVTRFETAVQATGATLLPMDTNAIDAIWTNRPAAPRGMIALQPLRYTGLAASRKLARVRKALERADALLVSDPHAVAWLFNLRGSDVAYTPVALVRAIVPREGQAILFAHALQVPSKVRETLQKLARIEEPDTIVATLSELGKAGQHLRVDTTSVPARLVQAFESAGGHVDSGSDPIALMKACKTPAELAGMRAAHLRDGIAVTRFLAWFDREAPKGRLTEIDAARALEGFRHATGRLKDLSFPTISGAGPNGAIVHYRVSESTNRRIGRGLFLIDSGAQYQDGTTDVTRTLGVGVPTRKMRDRFTRVLKGHIAIATSVFPQGVSGAQLDSLARRALWDIGTDFDHGTGHGVGAYLSVHEGPQRISKLGSVPLEAGMILSNEPGYYETGAYGIRIENLVVVEPRALPGADRAMLGFETLTLAPIDLRLVEPELLNPPEIAWLNSYHARVRRELSPHLDARERRWLTAATKAIGR